MQRLRFSFFVSISLAATFFSAGCSTPRGGRIGPRYLVQAALGQLQISSLARPISQVLSDGRLDSKTRQALAAVSQIKSFGESEGLKPTSSYQEYSDLKRSVVVWVATASEPLRFEAARWSFPIIGSFSYLGWFNRESGEGFRQSLESSGYDADLRPAQAYSTLGWFRDPLLSTMIPAEDDFGSLVEVILHESVHATLHLDNQSTLNESLAQFLGEKLAEKYLELGGPPARVWLESYRESLRQENFRIDRMRSAYTELEVLYRSEKSESEKISEKEKIFSKLRQDLKWPMTRLLNNATLIQFATYQSSPKLFSELWDACGKSARKLIDAVRAWGETDSQVRSGKELSAPELDALLSKMKTQCH